MTKDVDAVTETVIRRPWDEVAAYAGDPTNAPEWYSNIASVEWRTATYQALDAQSTRMTLRNQGRPTGFAGLASTVMTGAVRRANRADLARLRTLLEQR